MAIIYTELQVLGRQVPCAQVQFSFRQAIDEWGRPSSIVRIELLKVTLTGEAVGWGIWEALKFDEYRRVSGWLLGFDGAGQTARRYAFYDAALVELIFHYDGRGTQGQQAATGLELHFAPAAVNVDGQHIEAYSVIPWKTDPQTSLRALTKPADPLPSPHLAALLTAAKRKAEELGTGFVKQVLTPAGEVGTEFMGVSLAALARTASLTAGLLLTPTNRKDDPGDKSEWDLNKLYQAPTDKDRARLAYLEQEREHRALTEAEEGELVTLLVLVRKIYLGSPGALVPYYAKRTADLHAVVPDYENVHLAGSRGEAIGEFDGVNISEKLFIENKSARGLTNLNPATGQPFQSPASWAERQLYEKTTTRIQALKIAKYTYPQSAPDIEQIREFRRLHFRVEADTPDVRQAVAKAVNKLKAENPDWDFTAEYGTK